MELSKFLNVQFDNDSTLGKIVRLTLQDIVEDGVVRSPIVVDTEYVDEVEVNKVYLTLSQETFNKLLNAYLEHATSATSLPEVETNA